MPDTTDIGFAGLAASLVLVVVAVVLSMTRDLRLERTLVWAATRALVQLLTVGFALQIVLDPDSPIALAWLWVALMIVTAAVTVRQRASHVPGMFGLAMVATSCSMGVSLGVMFGLGIFPIEGIAIVPVAGMLGGNSIAATVSAARRIVAELADNRDEVEARLALGQPWGDASRPYVRSALRVAMTGSIESTKVVGLVSLPGTMTGLILAGVDPLDAVLVQAAVMYLILGSAAVNVVVISLGLTRRLFTPDHRLVPLARSVT
jgi:putative ABC transport system permease protein